MLIFVDYEHESRYAANDVDWLLAARTRITYRLEDLSGLPCMLVRYDRLNDQLLAKLEPQAIFISGQGAPPSAYEPDQTAALAGLVQEARLPMFGFCGGWQFMATALGASLEPITVTPEQRNDDIVADWGEGRIAEFGYHPVELSPGVVHPLLDGLGDRPVFRHAHGLHIAEPPAGFVTVASTPITPVQLAIDEGRRMVGTQFHPEYWTADHPAGRRLIENFLRWAGLGVADGPTHSEGASTADDPLQADGVNGSAAAGQMNAG